MKEKLSMVEAVDGFKAALARSIKGDTENTENTVKEEKSGRPRIFTWTESQDGETLTVSLTSNPEKSASFEVKNILPPSFREYWNEMKTDDVFRNALAFVLKQKASDSSVTGKTPREKFSLAVETAERLTSDDSGRTFNGIRTGSTVKKVVKVGIADVSAKAAQLDPAELEKAIAAAKMLGIDLSAILGK